MSTNGGIIFRGDKCERCRRIAVATNDAPIRPCVYCERDTYRAMAVSLREALEVELGQHTAQCFASQLRENDPAHCECGSAARDRRIQAALAASASLTASDAGRGDDGA